MHVELKTKVIPVIIGATGTILKSFRKYVSNVTGNHEFKKIQKNSHIGHCTHTSESANVETKWSQRRN
jgi:Sec-independent protein translocase protein TatA